MACGQIYLDDPNVGELEKQYLSRCIDSSFVSTRGPLVSEFETRFANLFDGRRGVALQSGTAGLHMAMYEMGIGEGDEVIMPVLTFVATANAVKYVGAKPVFVDVDPLTWNIDPRRIVEAISERTKAIVPVHLFGNPCAMDEIVSIAKEYGLYIIEDAAESLGARFKGKPTGTFGDFGIFSFNGNKVITTGGGGMILGKDEGRIQHIKFLVNQAREQEKGYYHPEVGFNYGMTNMEAALGLAQLERLQGFIKKKRGFYDIYTQMFKDIDELELQKPLNGSESMWWLSSLLIDTKRLWMSIPEIRLKLQEKGVPTRGIFMPLTECPAYLNRGKDKYTQAYRIYDNGLNLPCSTLNSDDAVAFAAKSLINIIKVGYRHGHVRACS